jgi:hypothetical protein
VFSWKNLIGVTRSWVFPLLVALTFVGAQLIETFHLVDLSKNVWIKQLAELALPVLILELLIYLMVERFREIIPLREDVASITPKIDAMRNLPTLDKLASLLDAGEQNIVSQLREPLRVEAFSTPEDTYSAIVRTIQRVEADKPDTGKVLRHAIFYASVQAGSTDGSSKEPEYFSRFKDKMKECVESKGRSRWDVKNLYNVANAERFKMIRDRCEWGDEGFEVYAVFMPDSITPISPMVIDEEDTFLAFFEASNYRVSSGIHIRNRAVASFFISHFNEIWNFNVQGARHQPIYRLRRETGLQEPEIKRLETAISRWAAR